MRVFIDNTPLVLNEKDVLGVGGEGTVFKAGVGGRQKAVKIYANPSVLKAEKLEYFTDGQFRLPTQVMVIERLVRDKDRQVIGFTMPLLDKSVEEVRSLANRKYRVANGITTKSVVSLFLSGGPILRLIHQNGFVVGDLNDLNVFFNKKDLIWIDVDSWQFGNFPCPVATEEYLDPFLYGRDLTKGPIFRPGNDWYSFAVMLFKSLLLVHPYGGTHKNIRLLTQRAAQKVTVLDKDVAYPTIAISFDILDTKMAELFEGYFKNGFRGEFPMGALREYSESLRECSCCTAWYPATNGSCPVCTAKGLVIVTRPPSLSVGGWVSARELLRVSGKILHARVVRQELLVLASERGKTVLYKCKNGAVSKANLFDFVPGARYEFLGNMLVVNHPNSSELNLFDISIETPKHFLETTTDIFAGNRKASFKCSDKYLFRISGSTLVAGEIREGRIIEKSLRRVIENQTWFDVSEESENPFVFGLFQVVRRQAFWMIVEGKTIDLDIPQLSNGETITDLAVKFSSQGALLLRKTLDRGVEYLRQDMVDKNGKVVYSAKTPASQHPCPFVHGQAYSTGKLLHPADKGLIQEEVAKGIFKSFSGSERLVEAKDFLLRDGNDILAVKEDRVLRLTLS